MYDIIIRRGTVVDGTGRPGFVADVGIAGGKISAIGGLGDTCGLRELDADGLIVSPGFIDIHSHSDFTLLADPRAQSSVMQGVTTELVGNCGHGCAPVRRPKDESTKGNIYGYTPQVPITWETMDGYLRRLETARPAVNVLSLVPNGMLRLAVVGPLDRPASDAEIGEMAALLEDALQEGAFGYSVGLEYPLERSCGLPELTALCRVTAAHGGLFAPHLRNREVRALEAIEEGLELARRTGVRCHVPHLTPRRGGPPEPEARALELIDRGLAEGLDLSIDMHTRLHGLTNLSAALPAWALQGGTSALKEHLSDPMTRREISHYESLITSFSLGGWEHVSLLTSASRPDLIGKSFAEIAEDKGVSPFDAVLDVLLDEAGDPSYPLCLCESYTEEQLLRTYAHPACMVASDATALGADGPLAGMVFHGAFTWAAWFFRRFVRERKAFSVEEAVRKVTSQPAARIGLTDRGVLREGNWADVAIFDPGRFRECGTLRQPSQPAEGMRHVIVNGLMVVLDGACTGLRGGRVLRHRPL